MINKKIQQLINQVETDMDVSMTPNQREQIKSILLKRFESEEWNGNNKQEVKKVINCVNSKRKIHELNFLEVFHFLILLGGLFFHLA